MSLPTIPNITPIINLDRCDTINLLLSSIAMEEIGLSNILNAEGEKLQSFLNTQPNTLNEYLEVNDSIIKMLRTVVKSQILLQFKLEDVIELNDKSNCNPPLNLTYRVKDVLICAQVKIVHINVVNVVNVKSEENVNVLLN